MDQPFVSVFGVFISEGMIGSEMKVGSVPAFNVKVIVLTLITSMVTSFVKIVADFFPPSPFSFMNCFTSHL